MKKKNNLLVAIAMMLVLTMTSLAQAALYVNVVTDEFSVESPYPVTTVKACECGLRTELIDVTNVGDFEALFTVEVFSPVIEYMTLSRSQFMLDKGENIRLNLFINAPCDIPLDSHYVVKVSTNYGRSKELYKEFHSRPCQNIKFTSRILNDTILPGEVAVIRIDLQNVGEFRDTFRIVPDANQPYVTQSIDAVELDPAETTTIYMYTKMPVEVYGPVDQPFTITSDKANNRASGSERFYIERDYDFSIRTDTLDLNVCEEVLTKEPITFTNLGSTWNEYYLSLKGPAFAKLSQESLSLVEGESDSITLDMQPAQLDVGTYEVSLNAKSKYGDFVKDKSFKLNVNDCYDSSATLNGYASLSDRDCCGDKEYTLNIVNRGLYEEAYHIVVDSEGWVTIDPANEYVRLRPGQQVNLPVKAHLPCTDMNRTSFILVKQLRAPYQTHEIRVDLESLSMRTCYDVQLVKETYPINYETENVPLVLKHTGLRGGTYRLELGELDTKFVELSQDTIELQPGDLKVLTVLPLNYSGYLEGTYLNKLTLNIRPVDENIDYDRQFWVVLKDKGFLAKAWDWLKGVNYTVIGFCGFVGLLLFLILLGVLVTAGFMKKENYKVKRLNSGKMKKLKMFNMLLVGVLLLAILFLIIVGMPDDSRFYEESSNNTSPLFHEWRQNSVYKLDLNQYFTDPDMDALTYTASQPDHIRVQIEGSLAVLTPEHGWSGTEYIVFSASDNRGGETDSTAMALHVMKKRPVGILECWGLYCKQINLVLIILICAGTLLITDIIEKKGYQQYKKR